MTFNELSKEWLEENHKHIIKDRTYLRYEGIIRCHIKDGIGKYDISELTSRVLQHELNVFLY